MEKNNIIHAAIRKLIVSKLEEIPFIVFLSFLCTFVLARSYVYVTQKDIINHPLFLEAVYIKGLHIHHLNFGIILLAITGFISLYDLSPTVHRQIAILYGIGLALTFDEFALWLKLQDDYNARITYDAITIICVILLNIIYFPSFWHRRGKQITSTYQKLKKLLWE